MRRKAKDSNLDHSTFSLSRLDSKRSSKSGQDYFLVEATGDMLENKPILKSDENDVGERSCDLINGLTSSESHTLERLNKLIGEDTLAFVRAKEDFKRNKNSPGILYSDVIRQSFKSVPYFHYADGCLCPWFRWKFSRFETDKNIP
jgi:hypothetical protein